MASNDCAVCEKLMAEKHRYDIVWRVLAVIFMITTVVLAVLYFSSGALVTETEIKIDKSKIGNENGDNVQIIIGGEGGQITGEARTTESSTALIVGAIIIGSVIIGGGVIIGCHIHKKD